MLLRRLREKARLIRYYSATRPYNRWSRALDIAMAAALVGAWGVVWALDRSHVRDWTPERITGRLFEDPDGRARAWVSAPPPATHADSLFLGSFAVVFESRRHGWPFVSSRRAPTATVSVHLVEGDGPLTGVEAAGTREGAAIEQSLRAAGRPDVAESLWAPGPHRHFPRAWIANGLIWSVLLVIASWLGVSMLRLASLPVEAARRARRERRRRGDRCIACGYDLRASARSDRCPECGTALW